MRIFATADIHGNKIIMQKIEKVLQQYPLDALIICGDVLENPRVSTLDEYLQYQRRNYQEFQEYVNSLNIPVFYILGNGDFLEGDETDKCYLGSPQGLFVPFDLVSITPFSTYREVTVEQQGMELSKLQVQPDTIIVAHDVPYGCLDRVDGGRQVGSTAIHELLREKQPSIWLGGHIHESFGTEKLYNTCVFNCSCDPRTSQLRGWIIDTSKEYPHNFIRIED